MVAQNIFETYLSNFLQFVYWQWWLEELAPNSCSTSFWRRVFQSLLIMWHDKKYAHPCDPVRIYTYLTKTEVLWNNTLPLLHVIHSDSFYFIILYFFFKKNANQPSKLISPSISGWWATLWNFGDKCKNREVYLQCRFLGLNLRELAWGQGICTLTNSPRDSDTGCWRPTLWGALF